MILRLMAAAILWWLCVNAQPLKAQGSPEAKANQTQAQQNDRGASTGSTIQRSPDQTEDNQASSTTSRKGGNGDSMSRIDEHQWEAWTAEGTLALVIATVCLVIATVVLAVATIGLYRQTKRLADQAVQQGLDTQQALLIAERTSLSASLSATSSRAWLTYLKTDIYHSYNAIVDGVHYDYVLAVSPLIINSGNSPAIKVKIGQYSRFVQPSTDLEAFGEAFPGNEFGLMTVAIGQSFGADKIIIHTNELENFNNGISQLFIAIVINYYDAFGKARRTEAGIIIAKAGEMLDPHGVKRPDYSVRPVGAHNLLT